MDENRGITNARQRLKSKTHLSREVIPSRQVFEAEETVPLAGSASAGVIVHNLAWRHKIQRHYTPRSISFYLLFMLFSVSPASMWFSVSLCLPPTGLI